MSAPEASIEDILDSIRKTFADAPEADGSKAVVAATDSVRSSGMPPFRSVAETPAGATSATPFPTPPRSRAAAIDDDLEDLIDKPVAASAPAPQYPEPKLPEARNGPSNAAMSSVEAAREKWANLLNPHAQANGAASQAPQVQAAQAQAPQPKADPAPQPMMPAPVPTPSGLFAPRKGGFYPPQDARPDPVLPMPTTPAAPMAVESTQTATPAFATAPGSIPAPIIEPAVAAAPTAAPRTGFIPFPQTAAPPAAFPPVPAPQAAPTAPATVAAPLAELPAASARALDDLVADLNNAAQAPAEPAPVLAVPAEPAVSVSAVASAPAPAPAPVAAAAPPAPTPVSAPIPQESSVSSSASRSFEDVVADMLRPLLEKWIDENMPRIVERALQRDAALGRKPGP